MRGLRISSLREDFNPDEQRVAAETGEKLDFLKIPHGDSGPAIFRGVSVSVLGCLGVEEEAPS